MPLYENSVIYKLVHKNDQDNENIYIGSTTNFRGRKFKHRNNCNNEKSYEYNFNVYQFIRENGGWDEWEMIGIENYPCESKRELEIRERFHIETLKSKLNRVIPTRTHKEYREDNKDLIAVKKRIYYDENIDKKKEYDKIYREENKEKKKQQQKQYRQDNLQKIKDKYNEKITCECGCSSTYSNITRHRKTDIHKKKMEELNK